MLSNRSDTWETVLSRSTRISWGSWASVGCVVGYSCLHSRASSSSCARTSADSLSATSSLYRTVIYAGQPNCEKLADLCATHCSLLHRIQVAVIVGVIASSDACRNEPLQFQITNILRRDECVDMASADGARLKRLVSNSESSRCVAYLSGS